jgi:hypothetical protein
MAVFLFATASVAVVMGLVGLVAGHWPRTPADPRAFISAMRGGEPMRARALIMALTLCCWGSFTPLPAADSRQARQARELGQEPRMAAERPLIHFHDGRLSVRLRHAPWAAVLPELAYHTGIRITTTGPLPGTLTREFAALPLEQGLRRLFREVNLLMLFAAGDSAVTVTHVWLFPKADRGAGQSESLGAPGQFAKGLPQTVSETPTAEAATGRAPAERLQALQLLPHSEGVDEKTVLAELRAALADTDAAVKGYAIQALAERGGTEALEDLRQAFRDPDPAIRRLVLENVIQLDEGLPLVQEALTDAEETIRALAHSRLKSIVSEPQ